MRDVVIERKQPRRLELYNNLAWFNREQIEPLHYPECFEGILASFADRFPCNIELLTRIKNEWAKTADYLRVQ